MLFLWDCWGLPTDRRLAVFVSHNEFGVADPRGDDRVLREPLDLLTSPYQLAGWLAVGLQPLRSQDSMTRRLPRPRLLTAGAAISTFLSAIWCVILFGYALGHGEISAAGEPIPRDQFFARGGGWLVAAIAIWAAVSVGLWMHRTWARPLALVFWLLLGGAMASASPDTSSAYGYIGFACACLVLAALYLYAVPGVRAYYESLDSPAQDRTESVPLP